MADPAADAELTEEQREQAIVDAANAAAAQARTGTLLQEDGSSASPPAEKRVQRGGGLGKKKFGQSPDKSSAASSTVQKISSLESAGSVASQGSMTSSTGGRAVVLSRSSMEDSASNHYRVMFMLQGISFFYALPTFVFVLVRNLVHCESEYVDQAIPRFFWHAVVEYGIFWWFCPVFAVQGLVIAFYPPEMLTTRVQRAIIGAWVFLLIVGGVFLSLSKTTNADPSNRITAVRVLGGLSVVIGQYLGMWHNMSFRRRQNSESEYTQRERSLLWWSLKFGLVFFAGFYGALLFADRFFPAAVEIMKKRTEDQGTKGLLIQSLFEMVLATFFFSVYLPIWSKKVSRIAMDILSLYHEHGERNTVIYERMQFTINFLLDVTRFVYGRGVLFSLSRVEVFFLLIAKDITYQFWHFAFKYSELYILFVLKLSDPAAVQGLPQNYQVIARYFKTYNAIAKGTEDFVRFLGIPKSLAVCWEENVDYNDHLGVGESREDTPMKIRVVFNNYGITVVNLPSKLKNLFKSAAEKSKEREAQNCTSAAASSLWERMSSKFRGPFTRSSEDDTSAAALKANLPAHMTQKAGGGAAPTGRARRASLSLDLGDMDDDWKKQGRQASGALSTPKSTGADTNTSIDSNGEVTEKSKEGITKTGDVDEKSPSNSAGRKKSPSGARRNSQNERKFSLGHELELTEHEAKLDDRQAGMLGLSAEQHATLMQKGYQVFRDVIPISREEQELLQSVVQAYQWFVFLRYQSRAGCKFFTSLIFVLAPLLSTLTPTAAMPGFKGLDDNRYFIAGLTFLLVDVLEWGLITFVLQFKQSRDIHAKVDYYRQLLTKDRMTLFLLFTCSWVAGIFMFNVSWNPFNALKLAHRLFDIGQDRGGVVPVGSDYSAAQWGNLKACTERFGGADDTMWGTMEVEGVGGAAATTVETANFVVASGGASVGSLLTAAAGSHCDNLYLYPKEETQKLGNFFYGMVFDQCN
mmetsp:Transcript_6409/g.15844  ORF Transcript_6409/g.15844 Transcript_6409/m.15844 type:complete len:976 (-) Transcript_6409:489-3416(-)|eukprot:CAMPEP_0178986906 /NCGR_PEP_ID=MMETSP0795-20121207/2964_1 /TAXON_ID=88552 /ORGANISM="Amoebophrya sp., Strain Ameob2" /LENGTH=975 /DNA_ID=CAMNT_0020678019 /DNA_START=176 /DNA_END=3103 /DNA_ORIENTATION=-